MFDLIPAHTFTKYAFTGVESCLLSYSFPAKFDIYRAGSHLKPVCFEPRARRWDFCSIFGKQNTLVLNKFM